MTTAVIYIHPVVNLPKYQPMARQFVQAYMDHPPGTFPHQVHVLVNGFTYPALKDLFNPLPVRFHQHNNVGKDLGAYLVAAQTIPCDLLVCLGAPVRPRLDGWLDWIVQCYLDHGPALYGAFAFHVPLPHIRTTCFWCPPELLSAYPYPISDSTRYQVEHGTSSLTLWAQRMGFGTYLVSKRGVFDMPQWHHVANGDCLFLDQHTNTLNYT